MPEWLPGVLTAVPALLAAGGLWWRVDRLEQDVKERATKESMAHLSDRLTKIETLLERLLDRLTRRNSEDTNQGGQ